MYLHRAGRSARAGRAGTSYVIVCEASPGDREVVKAAKEVVPVEIVDASSILRKFIVMLTNNNESTDA